MRDGWLGNTALQNALLRADPDASVILDAIRVLREDVKDIPADWNAADSAAGLAVLDDGGAKILGTRSTIADGATSNAAQVITDLDHATPHFAVEIEWGSLSNIADRELDRVTARLHPDPAGTGVTVTHWRAQLFRLAEVDSPEAADSQWTLQPISDWVEVAHPGGTSAYDVIFDFRSRTVSSAVRVGELPRVTGERSGSTIHARTYILIWAIKGQGEAATNVAWMGDSGSSTKSGSGYTSRHVQLSLLSNESQDQRGTKYERNPETGIPQFTLEQVTFTPVTVAFTGAGNRLDLGASPTDEIEVVATGQVPGGSSLTFEISPAGAGTWTEVFDGDIIGQDNTAQGGADLSGLSPAQTYDARVTLTPGVSSPIVRRFGVRERERTDLQGIAVLRAYSTAVDPIDLRSEIGRAEIEIIKDGIVDYRDFFTELFSENWIGQIEFRAYVGSPNLDRKDWMLLDSFLVEDQSSQPASGIVRCLNSLIYLRGIVPNDSSGERQPVEYSNALISTARADILTGQLDTPARRIGPGALDPMIDTDGDGTVDDTARVTRKIYDADGKAAITALDFLAGGATISSQGRLKWVRIHPDTSADPAPHPVAVIPLEEAQVREISPGYSERVAEFFVPWGWDERQNDGQGSYRGEVRAYHTQAISKLGTVQARQALVPKLDDEIAKWIPQSGTDGGGLPVGGLAELVAKRQVTTFGMGMLTVTATSTYPHPELEIGDVVAVQTDRFVGRHPSNDNPLRGMLWMIGPVIAVHDPLGQTITILVRSYEDILPGALDITRIGYAFPEILDAITVWDVAGAATVRASLRQPDSGGVKFAADDVDFPDETTVRAATVQACDGEGYVEVSMGGTWEIGDEFYLSGFAYEKDDATGAEQATLFKRKFKVTYDEPRIIATLDLDGDDLYLTWQQIGTAKQIRWLTDTVDAPTLGEVNASGAVDSSGSVLVHTFDPNGDPEQTVYVGFVGETTTGIDVTSLVVLPKTYIIGANRPEVTLVYLGRANNGDEKWLAVFTAPGANVAGYIRTYNKGSGAPAYTRYPGVSGFSTDPYAVPFTFAHPADGDPNVVIEAYAEDDSSPTLYSEVAYKESDSDTIPSGDIDLTIDKANEVYATPKAIDTDALSYRFKVVVAAAGSGGYSDPSLASDADVGVATLVGTGFGTQVKLSAVLSGIEAIGDDQEVFISGWVFNTATTTAAAQGAAIKSQKIRRSIPASFVRNAILSAWLEFEEVGGVRRVRAFWNLATADGTGSLKLEVTQNGTGLVTTKVNTPDKDGDDLVYTPGSLHAQYVLTATPYTDVDYGGDAGQPVVYTLVALPPKIKSAWIELEPRVNPPPVGNYVEAMVFWNLETDNVGSLKIVADTVPTSGSPITTKVNSPPKDDSEFSGFEWISGMSLTVTVTPYSAIDYGGVAGLPVSFTFNPRLAVEMTDQDGGQIVGPLAMSQTNVGGIGAAVDTGTGDLIVKLMLDRLAALASVDGGADYVVVLDATDGVHKKALAGAVSGAGGDHGSLSGLGDDDHTQYYNAARLTKAVIDALNVDADTLDGYTSADFALAGHGHDHGGLSGLGDDDHSQYTHVSIARTISAIHTFSTAGAPFAIGGASINTLVTGLNADKLDGYDASAFALAGSGITDHGALTGLGDDDHTQYARADGTRAFTGGITGTSASFSGDVTSNTSDARLKTDVRPVRWALPKLFLLRAVYYRWNALAHEACDCLDPTQERVGLFAQDVQRIAPQAIRPSPVKEGYLAFQPEMLLPFVVRAIQELAVLALALGLLGVLL